MRGSTAALFAEDQEQKRIKLYPGAGIALAAAALAIQGFLLLRAKPFSQLSLPLIVVVFLAMSRRNIKKGMLTGLGVGWAQDALTLGPMGVFGIVETCVGYAVASLSLYVNVEYYAIRSMILALAFIVHQALLFVIRNSLLGFDAVFDPLGWTVWAVAHAGIGLLFYPLFDKLRKAQ